MADNDPESFEITEDDWSNAMNPGFRKSRGLSKNKQIYGIWAADSSDEEPNDAENVGFVLGSHSKVSRSKTKSNVAFVSGGIKEGDRITKEQLKFKEEDEGVYDIRENFAKMKSNKTYGQMMAGMRASGTGVGRFGDFEKHTRGIGAKLLGKMGYKHGKGLGKEGKGIVEPIPVAKRPGRGAVGAYGPEASRPKSEKIRSKADSIDIVDVEDEEGEVVAASGQWRKDGNRKRPKYRYKTVDDLISEGGKLSRRLFVEQKNSTKVIDMTGMEQKIYSGYEAFSTRTKMPEEVAEASSERKVFDIPELTFNIQLLVDMTEDEIIRSDRQLRRLKDENIALEHEEKQLTTSVEQDVQEMSRLERLLQLIEGLHKKSNGDALTMDECVEFFKALQDEFYEEYKTYSLASMALTTVLPLIKEYLNDWQCLEVPNYCYDVLRTWRSVLEESEGWSGVCSLDKMDPYHRIMWECWMPRFRKAVQIWQPRQFEPMISFLENWLPLLPKWILDNILDQIILPRLLTEVENWDPLSDTVPLHSWLHPWLPLMGDRLQPVYAPIRHKLAAALERWHPSDASAKLILRPWKGVFSQGSLESFLSRHIVPKLEHCLQTFVVNPAQQKLESWHWVMDWLDLIGIPLMASLLVHHFFPKWQNSLATWLSSVSANYSEITNWYSGWKSLFNEELLSCPAIKEQFTYALTLMNRATTLGPGQAFRPPPPPSVVGFPPTPAGGITAASFAEYRNDMEFLSVRSAASTVPSNFKDLVERKAMENGLSFTPIPNRTHEGRPLYRFGPFTIYLDRSVIFCQNSLGWSPIALSDLVSRSL